MIDAQQMADQYFAFGVNHESSHVAQREPFELTREQHERMVDTLRDAVRCEWMLLVTCNRTEVYGYGSPEDADRIRAALSDAAGVPWPEPASFHAWGDDAAEHVIEVTSGLRSQVLGDVQIFHQVKDAYKVAHEFATVGTALHRLLHTANATSKSIASETSISRGNPSIASLASRVARRRVAKLRTASPENPVPVLVLGAGEMGSQIIKILSRDKAVKIVICNRSADRLKDISRRYSATIVPWSQRFEAVRDADVVFVTTSSREYVLSADALPDRNGRPLLVVDIAVPRNVDPAVSEVADCTVLDIDLLQEIDSTEKKAQELGLPEARRLADDATRTVMDWERKHRLLRPAVETLGATLEAVREREVSRNLHRFDDRDREELDRLTRSLMQKILAIPLVRLKSVSVDEKDLRLHVDMLASLFTSENGRESHSE